jgi:hypothetical protein
MCWLLCLSADIILLSLCAVHIETEVKLDFKDVLIRPKRFPSAPECLHENLKINDTIMAR